MDHFGHRFDLMRQTIAQCDDLEIIWRPVLSVHTQTKNVEKKLEVNLKHIVSLVRTSMTKAVNLGQKEMTNLSVFPSVLICVVSECSLNKSR